MINHSKLADLTITHKATDTTWHLHSQVLYGVENPEISASFIAALENSNFTSDSFRHFLISYYMNTMDDDLQTLCHWESVWEMAAMTDEEFVHAISIISTDGDFEEMFGVLLKAWFAPFVPSEIRLPFTLSHDSPIYPILFKRVYAHSHEPQFKSQLDTFLAGLEQNDDFFPSLTSFFAPVLISKTNETVPSAPIDQYEPRIMGFARSYPIITRCSKESQAHLDRRPSNFVFRVKDDNRYLLVCGWKLYSKWSWFKALVDSDMDESQSRIVTFPPSWDLLALQAVVIAMEMNKIYPFDKSNLDTIYSLLAVQKEYGLVSSDTNEPIECLKSLFEQCYKYGYDCSTQDPYNVLQMTFENNDPKYFQLALEHLYKHPTTFSISSFAKLSPEVIVLFSSPEALKQWKTTLAPESAHRIWDHLLSNPPSTSGAAKVISSNK